MMTPFDSLILVIFCENIFLTKRTRPVLMGRRVVIAFGLLEILEFLTLN